MAYLPKQLRFMRNLLTIAACLMCWMSAHAQGLSIDNNRKDVIWETSYRTTKTYDDILELILAYDVLDNVVTHRNMIAGDTYGAFLDYEAFGYRRAEMPLYLLNGRFKCRVIIHVADGMCSVEACHMRFVDPDGLTGVTYLYESRQSNTFSQACTLAMNHIAQLTLFEYDMY